METSKIFQITINKLEKKLIMLEKFPNDYIKYQKMTEHFNPKSRSSVKDIYVFVMEICLASKIELNISFLQKLSIMHIILF